MANLPIPLLLAGGAAAVYMMTRKSPTTAVGNGNGNGAKPNGVQPTNGGAEPAIGDTVEYSKTPQNGIMWKILRSPGGYTARWMDIRDQIWQNLGEFETAASAKIAIMDKITLGPPA